jgi:glucokinase
VERIGQCVTDLSGNLPDGAHIAALGICCPGPLDHLTGTLINPPNLPELHNTPLKQMLAEQLNLPVSLEHDAKAAALGEFYFGAGQDERSMVYIVVGTGVGAAIIMDGQLYRGMRNYAGEFGHTTLDQHGVQCACGSQGCVETYMSGPWLAYHYERLLEQEQGHASERVTGRQVANLATQGDRLAMQVMNNAGKALGTAVATMAMILDIELFVVGGSVAKSGDLLIEPARENLPKYSFKSVSSRTRLIASKLGEDAPLLGCAWLARQALGETKSNPINLP